MRKKRVNVGLGYKGYECVNPYVKGDKSALETCYDWMKESPFKLEEPQEPKIWTGDWKDE